MPRFDGTGPFGQGPMGRGLGLCGAGRRGSSGFGRGARGFSTFQGGWNWPRWGCGGPWGSGYTAPQQWSGGYGAPQDEAQALKQEASYLQSELAAIQKRLNELEGA
jgi:hypothetical protein